MILISHKKEDVRFANGVAMYLKDKNIDCYLDNLDDTINKDNVTKVIVHNLRGATHLIVIFSEKTEKSMWVPFELGIAYERNQGIGVMKIDNVKQPEYLKEFPVMTYKDEDINKFIKEYRKTQSKDTTLDGLMYFKKSENSVIASANNHTAQDFINSLKQSLKQG